MLRKNREEIEKEKEHERAEFQKRREAAKFNLDNHYTKKQKEREDRENEKARFSPEKSNDDSIKKPLCETKVAGVAVPMKVEHAPKVQFSDFMNDVFAEKRHRAYDAIDRQTKRVEFIHNKFRDSWVDANNAEFDRRIQE